MTRKQSYWGCQQVLISTDKELSAILEYICTESNKIYNCSVYYARQMWLKTKTIVGRAELCAKMKHNRHFTAMYVSASQQVCNGVVEAFRSFQKLNYFGKTSLTNDQDHQRIEKLGCSRFHTQRDG